MPLRRSQVFEQIDFSEPPPPAGCVIQTAAPLLFEFPPERLEANRTAYRAFLNAALEAAGGSMPGSVLVPAPTAPEAMPPTPPQVPLAAGEAASAPAPAPGPACATAPAAAASAPAVIAAAAATEVAAGATTEAATEAAVERAASQEATEAATEATRDLSLNGSAMPASHASDEERDAAHGTASPAPTYSAGQPATASVVPVVAAAPGNECQQSAAAAPVSVDDGSDDTKQAIMDGATPLSVPHAGAGGGSSPSDAPARPRLTRVALGELPRVAASGLSGIAMWPCVLARDRTPVTMHPGPIASVGAFDAP